MKIAVLPYHGILTERYQSEIISIHTDAIKSHIIPKKINSKQTNIVYANEADVLNVALLGQTAKQWREANPNLDGNMREFASIEQLLVLANIEAMNAEFIRKDFSQPERLKRLNDIAIVQLRVLTQHAEVRRMNTQQQGYIENQKTMEDPDNDA